MKKNRWYLWNLFCLLDLLFRQFFLQQTSLSSYLVIRAPEEWFKISALEWHKQKDCKHRENMICKQKEAWQSNMKMFYISHILKSEKCIPHLRCSHKAVNMSLPHVITIAVRLSQADSLLSSTPYLPIAYLCWGLISTPQMSVFSYKLRAWNKPHFVNEAYC